MSELIFLGASFLTRPEAPGLVSIGLLFALAVAIVLSLLSVREKLVTLRWLEGLIAKTGSEEEFTVQSPRIDAAVNARRARHGYRP